jgi:hypothetical protein
VGGPVKKEKREIESKDRREIMEKETEAEKREIEKINKDKRT